MMKKLALVLTLVLGSTTVWAQTGVFPANTFWGNGTGLPAQPKTTALPGGFAGFANPTASVGPAAVNGTAATAMRSDAAPALANTSVTPGSYGSSTAIPSITVDAQGRLTSAGTNPPATATSSTLGVVKPDNVTVTIAAGALSAVGGVATTIDGAGGTSITNGNLSGLFFDDAGNVGITTPTSITWNKASKTLALTGGTWDGANFVQAPVGFNNLLGWTNTAFSNAAGTTLNCGNGTAPDRSCRINLGVLNADTRIDLPDGGSFNAVGTPSSLFNALFLRSPATAGQTEPATFFAGTGAVWMSEQLGGLAFRGESGTQTPNCYGGAGGSPGCAIWGMNFLNELGWQVWGQQQAANDNQDLMIGLLRSATDAGMPASAPFNTGIAQIFFSDVVVAGGISGPGTAFTLTGGSGYVDGTYVNVPLAVSGHGQYTQQVIGTLVVAGGIVTSATILAPDQYGNAQIVGFGVGLHKGDILTTSNTHLGGSGSGFKITVTTLINGRAAPQLIGLFPGAPVIWGIGPSSGNPNSQTLRLSATENSGTAWYNSDSVSLALDGGVKLGTGNGVAHYPTPPDGQFLCGEHIKDVSGTLSVLVCDPVATFAAIGSGSAAGTGYTPGSYSNVSMASDWGVGSDCTGVTADIVVSGGGSGVISSFTLNAPGTGCSVDDRLIPDTGTIGVGTGGYAKVATIATTPAPISVKTVQYQVLTVATLPTCNTGAKGKRAVVSDALAPAYLTALTGGSTTVSGALCNGSAWVSG